MSAEITTVPGPADRSSPASASGRPDVAHSEAWKVMGRETPAGKALYKLYGGDFGGKAVGKVYHERNKELHEKKVASGWNPSPLKSQLPEIQRPQVNYPKFGSPRPGSGDSPNASRLRQIPHRKPGEQIMKELHEEAQRMKAAQPPQPKGPLLDEAEKSRLAMAMQFRGKVPQASTQELEEAARHRGVRSKAPRSEREELQALFKATMEEVEDRKAFLAEMEAQGALKKDHVHQIQGEIRIRVEDMHRLDRMLRDLDARGQR
ncbi:hypothetical protein CEUSTIGMA_g438.t1 [Chlamydomonas eustigma]|uniref:Uncharacterized protein n=1 Tax=Chlamydomonas eustigma TaxID=1157962 RepID=A0A250WQL3_9CHLO|nr:hypothetical protein CEUSTIGMA_g438.t1 [Chlamydomonas eustigma]|eukprot:GAX72986.1 hypothetical protein CEUSTIGMA_g438.t1 [Chlamydomonas eustigma]